MALDRAKNDDWVRQEYERSMGFDALTRQSTEARRAAEKCKCVQREFGSNGEAHGPHHKVACPMYAPDHSGR